MYFQLPFRDQQPRLAPSSAWASGILTRASPICAQSLNSLLRASVRCVHSIDNNGSFNLQFSTRNLLTKLPPQNPLGEASVARIHSYVYKNRHNYPQPGSTRVYRRWSRTPTHLLVSFQKVSICRSSCEVCGSDLLCAWYAYYQTVKGFKHVVS